MFRDLQSAASGDKSSFLTLSCKWSCAVAAKHLFGWSPGTKIVVNWLGDGLTVGEYLYTVKAALK